MRIGVVLLMAAVAQAASTSGFNSSSLTTLMARVPHCAVGSPIYQDRKRRCSDLPVKSQIGCLLDGYRSAHCPIDKITDCVCTDIPLQARSSQCVQQSCDFNDQIGMSE